MCYLLDLLVHNDANSMLGYVVYASRFTMVAFVRHSFLNGACALERERHHSAMFNTQTLSSVGNLLDIMNHIKSESFVQVCRILTMYLDINNVTLLVDAHVGGQGDWA